MTNLDSRTGDAGDGSDRSSTAVRQKAKKVRANGDGWQAEKSAMTRKAIIDAAITCFVERGYTRTTTALIAAQAGVSRGAMMHHFPSRFAVLQAVVSHLHATRLMEYRELMQNIDDPEAALERESIRKSVVAAWKYVNLPSFVAYEELRAASRTDAELGDIIADVEKDFDRQFLQTVKTVFPHWTKVQSLEAAHDLVQFVMQGMANSHMGSQKKKRADRVIDLVTDTLMRIYQVEAD
ncbi:TetR/AcrR family transcriptional regulator [Luminiphilus syltensis]|nr:TetR/AcrR family transcriptional regulator [Luminiphilus syltensis]